MGKIWIKTVDTARQCCGCEGKTSPCDTCCSFDLTSLVGEQTSEADADDIFDTKVIECRPYFPIALIKNSSELGEVSNLNRLNIIQSLNYSSLTNPKTYIDESEIKFYHVDGYNKNTNGILTIVTEGEIIDSTKKIKPPREDFCSENYVEYRTNPPIEYDIELLSENITDNGYSYADGQQEELDAPESEVIQYATEENYSEIQKNVKITNEICCGGTKYKFTQILTDVTQANLCDKKGLGVYKSFTWNETTSFFNMTIQGYMTASNLRFNASINQWQIDINGFATVTENNATVLSSHGFGMDLGIPFGNPSLRFSTTAPVGSTTSINQTFILISPVTIPFLIRLGGYYGYDPTGINPGLLYIIPDCSSIIENGLGEETTLGENPECNELYACIRKDNITKYQEILQDGAGQNDPDCSSSTDTSQLENQVDINPNLMGIIALSLLALAGGGLAGFALVVATGIFGLGLATTLYFYSVKVGASNEPIDENGESTYEENELQGTEDPSCDIIGEGNMLKTTEVYSVVGKRILFPEGGGPPDDVTPYAPKYSLIRSYSSTGASCVKIITTISRRDSSFNGVCTTANENYDNIAIAYKSEIIDNLANRSITKRVFAKVNSIRHNC